MIAAFAAFAMTITGVALVVPATTAQAVTGTKVFDLDLGSGAGKDSLSAGVATDANGHKLSIEMGGYTEQADSVTTTETWATSADDDIPPVVWKVDASPTYSYDLDPYESDFEFTMKVNIGTHVNLLDSTNLFQKGQFQDPGQWKLQMDHNSGGSGEGKYPECFFKGLDNVTNTPVEAKGIADDGSSYPNGLQINDNASHTLTCARVNSGANDIISITVDGEKFSKTVPAFGDIHSSAQVHMLGKSDEPKTPDTCAACVVDYAEIIVADPKNLDGGLVDEEVDGKYVMNVDIEDNGATSSLTGTQTGDGVERVYEDSTRYQNDLYYKATTDDLVKEQIQNIGFGKLSTGDYGRFATSTVESSARANAASLAVVGSNEFETVARFHLTQTSSNTQVVFTHGLDTEEGYRLRIQPNSTVPECVFRDNGGQSTTVTATQGDVTLGVAGDDPTTKEVHEVSCYRDQNNIGIEIDGTVRGYTALNTTPGQKADGSLYSGSPLVLGRDNALLGSIASRCIGCSYDNVSVEIKNPQSDPAPWQGGAGSWTKRAEWLFNGSYGSSPATVTDQQGLGNLSVKGTFTDINGALRKAIKFQNKSVGTGPEGGGVLDPTTDVDFRYSATFKVWEDRDIAVPIVQKGRSGMYWRLMVTEYGRAQCVFSDDAGQTLVSVESDVYVADGKWHEVECARFGNADQDTYIGVDGVFLDQEGTEEGINNALDILVAHKADSGADYANANQARVTIDQVTIWKTYS